MNTHAHHTHQPHYSYSTNSPSYSTSPPSPYSTSPPPPPPPPPVIISKTYTTASSRARADREFRGSNNPDEDWTKISDLAERRRIQNRIAQRNYRKKLKRRLEDLERRAASRSLSPNGDDTDGRSTRESSAEGVVSPPPSSDPTANHIPSSSSEYGSNYYRTASSNYSSPPPPPPPPSSSSSSSSPSSYYSPTTPTTTTEEYTPASSYMYSYSQPTLSGVVEATCGAPQTNAGASFLPLPSARLAEGSHPYSGGQSYYSGGSGDGAQTYYPAHTAYYTPAHSHHHHHLQSLQLQPLQIKQEH